MQTHTHLNMTITKTIHAQHRIAQRGICIEALMLVALYGTDFPAGRGCVRRALHLSQTTDLNEQGYNFALIEKALHLEAVFSNEDELITCYQRSPKRACLGTSRGRKRNHATRQNRRA